MTGDRNYVKCHIVGGLRTTCDGPCHKRRICYMYTNVDTDKDYWLCNQCVFSREDEEIRLAKVEKRKKKNGDKSFEAQVQFLTKELCLSSIRYTTQEERARWLVSKLKDVRQSVK